MTDKNTDELGDLELIDGNTVWLTAGYKSPQAIIDKAEELIEIVKTERGKGKNASAFLTKERFASWFGVSAQTVYRKRQDLIAEDWIVQQSKLQYPEERKGTVVFRVVPIGWDAKAEP